LLDRLAETTKPHETAKLNFVNLGNLFLIGIATESESWEFFILIIGSKQKTEQPIILFLLAGSLCVHARRATFILSNLLVWRRLTDRRSKRNIIISHSNLNYRMFLINNSNECRDHLINNSNEDLAGVYSCGTADFLRSLGWTFFFTRHETATLRLGPVFPM
jgi:hypothetical protein